MRPRVACSSYALSTSIAVGRDSLNGGVGWIVGTHFGGNLSRHSALLPMAAASRDFVMLVWRVYAEVRQHEGKEHQNIRYQQNPNVESSVTSIKPDKFVRRHVSSTDRMRLMEQIVRVHRSTQNSHKCKIRSSTCAEPEDMHVNTKTVQRDPG